MVDCSHNRHTSISLMDSSCLGGWYCSKQARALGKATDDYSSPVACVTASSCGNTGRQKPFSSVRAFFLHTLQWSGSAEKPRREARVGVVCQASEYSMINNSSQEVISLLALRFSFTNLSLSKTTWVKL